jgi:hypothetical protein
MSDDGGRGEQEHRDPGGVQVTAKAQAGATAGGLPDDVLAGFQADVLADFLADFLAEVIADVLAEVITKAVALVLVPLLARAPEKVTVHSGNARAERAA